MAVTIEDVTEDILEELPALQEWSIQRIHKRINDGILEVAAGNYPEYPEFGEIYLRDLEVIDTIDITQGSNNVNLSNLDTYTYMKGLSWAYSVDRKSPVRVLPSLDQLKDMYPGVDEQGSAVDVAVSGNILYYQRQENATLRVKFFKQPTTITAGDQITEIPEQYVRKLLVSYVLMRVPASYKKDLGYNPEADYRATLGKLFRFYGPYEVSPPGINDQTSGIYYNYGYVW